ncbi:MAG: adenylosuccinate lyase [Gammaproteobacteria bacterium]|nr:adenylosuccinate lyase [Gammaproteobacteria bacterium]|tara:strand:- start:4323 stop:5693 length:1371 start_codon:yes stop_codon:yes gene_type:complete
MKKYDLLSISPIDGRYSEICHNMTQLFSEYALIKNRVFVEIKWLIFLSDLKEIKSLPKLSNTSKTFLLDIYNKFSIKDAEKIKKLESVTKHDVKAIEYFIKDKIKTHKKLKEYTECVHICCTSEDINNMAYALMIKHGRQLLSSKMNNLNKLINKLVKKYAKNEMISHTHGQVASPTTMGKEFLNFYTRLMNISNNFCKIDIYGKFNGATGNYSSHSITFPNVNWPKATKKFIESFDIKQNKYTTQIEPHDYICQLSNTLTHYNSILIGLSQDIWTYISKHYFIQKNVKGEIGSSTMPHKINPINFENAEGNLGVSNSLLKFFSEKLVISRLQRDLSDSTVLRNIGISFSYSYLAYENMILGLNKISINNKALDQDLSDSWEILAEPIQMIARKYNIPNSYEILKKETRGKKVTKEIVQKIINNLMIPESDKRLLLNLTPKKYIGYAVKMTYDESK